MPNGTLKLYNKLDNTLLVSLDILGTFNIEENLNETPSNMKVKVITSNTYREEFQVNTIAYHEDTDSWWVIKSDESTYLYTGEYEHEIQLTEYLEFYAYRHLPNCAFAPNTYTLEQTLERLFDIAKLSITTIFPTFLNKDKIMPFVSFENYTVSNAIKNVARTINAIPKMSSGFPYEEFTGSIGFSMSPPSTPTNGDYWYRTDTNQLYQRIAGAWVLLDSINGTTTPSVGYSNGLKFVNTATQELFIAQSWTPILTFINRNGLSNAIVNTLDTQFPIAYEKNTNSNDQFTTRSVSNISNAKSSSLVIAPKQGGFKNIVPNAPVYNSSNRDNARVLLPSKIDRVAWVKVFPPMRLIALSGGTTVVLYEGYYTDVPLWRQAILDFTFPLKTPTSYTTAEKEAIADELPEPNAFHQINYNDVVDINYNPSTSGFKDNLFYKKMGLLNKFSFDTTTVQDTQDRTIHWLPFTNELVMPLDFRNGINGINDEDHNRKYRLFTDGTYEVYMQPIYRISGFFTNAIPNEDILIQVAYYPIADIKVSIDNDNDAQDEKFFNQSGKVIDAVGVSKLITAHTNDSVDGTKIRNARYTSIASVLPVGQLVRDSTQLYVITQRSIDGQVKNGNEYYNVLYTLSRNRIARSENIIADSAVISYKTPDNNLVFRTQLYKDYIELSLVDNHQETPYLNVGKVLVLSNTLAGTNFDYTVLAKNDYGTTPTIMRYIQNPTNFELHKSKLMNIDWQDNNVLGYRLDSTGATYVQTPIVYTNDVGKATDFELLFLDTIDLELAKEHFDTNYTPDSLAPFTDLTQVDEDFYEDSVLVEENYSIKINELTYNKDGFEIPVFEYMIQANDDYSANGNIAIGNDLFSTFTGTLRYHYVINNTTRFTAENADKLYADNPPSSTTNRRTTFARDSGTPHIIDLDLFSTFSGTRNTSAITNVGIYATDGTTVKFLFAINDYVESGANDKSNIRVYINNWKI